MNEFQAARRTGRRWDDARFPWGRWRGWLRALPVMRGVLPKLAQLAAAVVLVVLLLFTGPLVYLPGAALAAVAAGGAARYTRTPSAW